MVDHRHCRKCGALESRSDARYCWSCGASFARWNPAVVGLLLLAAMFILIAI